jgi:2-C-methyl-D-erythritol 2,4-cyclodiphosphate synthase
MNQVGFRIGLGYDLHRLERLGQPSAKPIRPLVVGGVVLPHSHGLVAHSDGDVLYHAIVDALMGALCMPDIGQLFPDNSPENEGRDSAVFMLAAAERIRAAGWRVGNVDATIILERPRISPVKDQMRENCARLLGVDVSQVNVKGKSHEKVDAVGEGRAIEAHVAALLVRA